MNLLPLTPNDFQPGVPLAEPLFDEDGHLLFQRGENLPAGYPIDGLFRSADGDVGNYGTQVEEFSAGDPIEDMASRDMFPPVGIKPQMWEVVQLRLLGRRGQPRYYSRLVGYIPETSILVAVPKVGRKLVPLKEGESVEVRMLTGRNIYHFQGAVLKACSAPAAYAHLAFPAQVQRQHLRKAPWAKMGIAVAVTSDGKRLTATLANLSATGGRIEAAQPLGVEGSVVNLQFRGEFDGDSHEFNLEARIMKVRPRNGGGAEHGVEFLEPGEQDARCLRCLVYQRIAEGFLV